ncbi:MAG: hypothetical protein IJP77_02700 [Bacteroidales bacterium]|nr:hypothetical protein [Bacteroidales bacterium]
METSEPLLSLCIPTNGRVDWISSLLSSIYSQQVDNTLFEVVITDNARNPELEKAVAALAQPNLKYYPTDSAGFTNQVDAFEKCSGVFCKMLNHRCVLLPGSIGKLIGLVREYQDSKPLIYCSNGHIKGPRVIDCPNLDSFVRNLSYFSSWSAGTAVWKDDMKGMREKPVNSTFPHTLFLFQLREESRCLIWNVPYHYLQDDVGKGGYNPFEAFGITFLDILSDLKEAGRIGEETYQFVKKDIFSFLKFLYFNEVLRPTKNSYILTDIRKIVTTNYGKGAYLKIVLHSLFVAPVKMVIDKIKRMAAARKNNN